MCTKNYDQMMYGSWDMACDGWTDRQTETDRDRQTDRQTDEKSDI